MPITKGKNNVSCEREEKYSKEKKNIKSLKL